MNLDSTPRSAAPAAPTPIALALGARCPLYARRSRPWTLDPRVLRTHGVVLGMTGSGKTGLLTVLTEEALRARIPTLLIDVKGDLANLALAFSTHDPALFAPWIAASERAPEPAAEPTATRAARVAQERREGLARWQITDDALARFASQHTLRILTPGSTAGEPLHLLSSLERRAPQWDRNPESARSALSSAVSLLLRLLDRDPDPASSRDHVLLAVLAERRLRAGLDAPLDELVADVEAPPFETLGAQRVDEFMPRAERRALAAALNTLLASPSFSSWRTGATLDVDAWFTQTPDGRTPATVLSVAHLDDEERTLVLGVVLEEVRTWMRAQPGSDTLRALVVFDEVSGFLPPYPAKPPTRRPLVAMLKQGRAFGLGLLLATQNPMDLDYRSLSNAGLWCVGRLQTDADRARIIEALASGTPRADARDLAHTVKGLAKRWFVVRDASEESPEPFLAQPRHAMSWLRGPLTRDELARLKNQPGA